MRSSQCRRTGRAQDRPRYEICLAVFALGHRDAGYDDTMLMSYALDAGRQNHDLASLAESIFTHAALFTPPQGGQDENRFRRRRHRPRGLAAESADIVAPVAGAEAAAPARTYGHRYETLERPLVRVFARMDGAASRSTGRCCRGCPASSRRPRGSGPKSGTRRRTINPGSPKQLGDILFGKLDCRAAPRPRPGTGGPPLRAGRTRRQGHELPTNIFESRKITKLKSTYTDAGRASEFDPTNAARAYGLRACFDHHRPAVIIRPRFQNVAIRTEDGRKKSAAPCRCHGGDETVSADYSQIELQLLLRKMAGIAPLQEASWRWRRALHRAVAHIQEMFGVPVKGMPAPTCAGTPRRSTSASSRPFPPFGLANQLGIGREEAGAYIKKYFERFPGIRDYIEEIQRRSPRRTAT